MLGGTGLRAKSFLDLTFNMFRMGVTDDGVEYIQAHLGSMKNQQRDLDHLDVPIFKQKVLGHPDKRCGHK